MPDHRDESGWLPIETAPKDDRQIYNTPMPREYNVILGFRACDVGGNDPGICVGYWDAYYAPGGSGYYDGCSEWVIADCGETTDLHYGKPSHWMPLPDLPA